MKERKHAVNVLLVLLGTSLVYAALYRRFLFGDCIYLFSDTGSDSIAASYPILAMLSALFQKGQFSSYTLFSGLGQDTTATFLQFLNPLKFFMLFFDKDSMPTAILIQLYLQTVVSGLAFYGYIRRHLKYDAPAVLAAVIWPFASYTMLWSQNLSYGTAVCMFMVALFLIEELLDCLSLRSFLWLALLLAVFVSTNYYFTYMTGIFAVLYIPIRSIVKRVRFPDFLKGYLLTALSAVFALLLSAAAAVAIAANFLQSARTEDVASLRNFIPGIIRPSFAAAALARLFSENMLGIGSDYSGPTNYYEIAAVFTSVLFLIAFFYFLRKKGIRLRLILLTLFSIVCIMHPLARYILDLSALCMRFGFMICFMECLLIGLLLDELFAGADAKALRFSLIGTPLFTAVSFAVLYFLQGNFGYELSYRTMLFSAGWTLIITAVLALMQLLHIPKKLLPCVLFVLLAGEIVIMHHDVLYLRLYLTKDSFGSSFFSDGTEEAVRAIEAQDAGLYRIAATSDADLSNIGQVLHFNGTSLRNNTNPQPLIDLEQVHGTNERYTPYFLSGYPQYFQFTLLAGKYIVTNETANSTDALDTNLFERIGTYAHPAEGIDKAVYENDLALPFGYVYTTQIASDAWEKTGLLTRMHLLASSWFYTHAEDEAEDPYTRISELPSEAALAGEDTRIDLMEAADFYEPHNLKIEQTAKGLRLTATDDDPYIFVRLPEYFRPEMCAAYLDVEESGKKNQSYTLEYFYLKNEEAAPDPAFSARMYLTPEYPESLILMPEGVTGFRFDFDDDIESAVIGRMELVICEDPSAHLSELRKTEISKISFSGDTYEAEVTTKGGGMLCIPLLYSDNWHATVDGAGAEVVNINGGLCGIRLGKGSVHIRMTYRVPYFTEGIVISAAAFALWIGLFVFSLVKRKGRKAALDASKDSD